MPDNLQFLKQKHLSNNIQKTQLDLRLLHSSPTDIRVLYVYTTYSKALQAYASSCGLVACLITPAARLYIFIQFCFAEIKILFLIWQYSNTRFNICLQFRVTIISEKKNITDAKEHFIKSGAAVL